MAIEERAKEYAADEFLVRMSHSKTIEDIAIRAYSKGATEQKQIDIQNAYEWLEDCDLTGYIEGSYFFNRTQLLKDFRKAMEG